MNTEPDMGSSAAKGTALSPGAQRLREEAIHLPSWDLGVRQVWDIELLLNGGFSPLTGFQSEAAFLSVCKDQRLPDGSLWPIPVPLDVTESFVAAAAVRPGSRITLRHPEGIPLAILSVEDVYRPDRAWEAECVFGTRDDEHPGVFRALHETNPVYLGGSLEGIELPPHHTFLALRHTPAQLRAEFGRRGWKRVVAFQTRNPIHKAHVALLRDAAASVDAATLLHPAVGRTSPRDLDYFTRVRSYQAVLPHLHQDRTLLSLLPLAMRMAGPREALWHAVIRRNYGATHFIVGRDHAGPTGRHSGRSFYAPNAAQDHAKAHEDELGVEILPLEEYVYVPSAGAHMPRSRVPPGVPALNLSGTELRRRLRGGEPIPDWFTFPEVASVLQRATPPPEKQGFTVFFTGLPSSGKSTLAQTLMARLLEEASRPVTLLDGDVVRKHLSSELGFTREHRDLNILRIGFVASEITKNGGVAICAPIAPYAATRRLVREMIEAVGGFILVHVATPVSVCEARDRKGLYRKARLGLLPGFTGIDDPFESPGDAEVVIDTTATRPEDGADAILRQLHRSGYIQGPQTQAESRTAIDAGG